MRGNTMSMGAAALAGLAFGILVFPTPRSAAVTTKYRN
jgi:hypothetical protein